ncbi:MAG TPA: monovalent cation/H(+) antiporter subunit G [Solirubrobacteraceae bacterium]|nr:monovalent cation/H(+) antiporter subunit G [Solirubrobacteraceae bacterium]
MTARHVVAEMLVWIGVALILIACVGMVILRSAYDRLHFSSPAILGVMFVAASVVVKESFSLIGNKSILIAVLVLLGSPLITQASGRVARIREWGDWRLADDEKVEVEER